MGGKSTGTKSTTKNERSTRSSSDKREGSSIEVERSNAMPKSPPPGTSKLSGVIKKRSKRYNLESWLQSRNLSKMSDNKDKKKKSPNNSTSTDQDLAWNMLEQVAISPPSTSEYPPLAPPLPKARAPVTPPEPPPRGFFQRSWQPTELGRSLSGEAPSAGLEHNAAKPPPTGEGFTLVSYNILAHDHMQHHRDLYKGIPDSIVSWVPRYPRLLRHLLSFNGDLLCLQEVQSKHYEENLLPDLRAEGYEGLYKRRTGGKPDGCAIFYKKDKFKLESTTSVEYNQACYSLDRDNIALLATLTLRNGSRDLSSFVVATTHLLYNPRRSDVRLAQMALVMAELDRVASSSRGVQRLPAILTGDFNSPPESPEFNLVKEGWARCEQRLPVALGVTDQCKHIDQILPISNPPTLQHRLYHSQSQPKPVPCPDPYPTALPPTVTFGSGEMYTDFAWKSAYKIYTDRAGKFSKRGSPSVTTHHDRWMTVDYILYSGRYSERYSGQPLEGPLKLVSRLLMPTEKEALDVLGGGGGRRRAAGLPTEAEPSDHFALVAKFIMTKKRK